MFITLKPKLLKTKTVIFASNLVFFATKRSNSQALNLVFVAVHRNWLSKFKMSLTTISNLIPLRRTVVLWFQLNFPRNSYAKATSSVSMLGMKKKKVAGKAGPMVEKKILPVETDPERLVNYCCGSNIYKTGEDVKLGPDSEYPEWLWTIRTGPPPPLEELDPNSKEYWRRIRKMGIQRQNQLSKLKKF